jgi:hypothetical protein
VDGLSGYFYNRLPVLGGRGAEEPIMKAKWAILYLKYRRYLIPAAVVVVLLVVAYFVWGR